jgi:hypothetical protein
MIERVPGGKAVKFSKIIVFIFLLMPLPGISQAPSVVSIKSLKFINEYVIPFNVKFKETTVGGLSGIDYDKHNDIFYFICDDRSAINPARFYTAKIKLSDKGIDTVQFVDVKSLLQPNGEPYPPAKQDLAHTVDPEAIRFNPQTNQIVWTSEGERMPKSTPPVLVNPSINISALDGNHVGSFETPSNLTMQMEEVGPHQNGALEGITFDPDFKTIYAAMEEPLYEDGPVADVTPTNSLTRIFAFDASTKRPIAQYAYALEPVAKPANPPTAFKINGISEILSLGDKHLLVIERSFSTGNLACTVKVFATDVSKAANVEKVKSMKESPPKHLAEKRLVLNMNDLGMYIDNIEGLTFGPDLPNGHKTLLFVSDNNFNAFETMQLLFFEVIP